MLCTLSSPLEVLRISTVVDLSTPTTSRVSFGSAKNFYCCRLIAKVDGRRAFGSAKNFYCCRCLKRNNVSAPLEVLRISTVVDFRLRLFPLTPLEVLRISTVVDKTE